MKLMSAVVLLGCTLLCSGVRAAEGITEGACSVMAADLSGDVREVPVPALHVMKQTEAPGAFALPADAPPVISGVQCVRSTLVPALNDYKVLLAGFPFSIVTADSGEKRRQISLAVEAGHIQVHYRENQLSKDEERVLQRRLDQLQQLFERGDKEQ